MKQNTRYVVLITMAILIQFGCATVSSVKTKNPPEHPPSDIYLIRKTIDTWKNALIAKNIDQIMMTYSEQYRNRHGDDKQAIRRFLTEFCHHDTFNGMVVDLSRMKITINGATAIAAPIEISSERGGMTLSVTLGKEENQWLIVGSNRKMVEK